MNTIQEGADVQIDQGRMTGDRFSFTQQGTFRIDGTPQVPVAQASGLPPVPEPRLGDRNGALRMRDDRRLEDGRLLFPLGLLDEAGQAKARTALVAELARVGRPEMLTALAGGVALLDDGAPVLFADLSGFGPQHQWENAVGCFPLAVGVQRAVARHDLLARLDEQCRAAWEREQRERKEHEKCVAERQAKEEAEQLRTAPWRALPKPVQVAISAAMKFSEGSPERRFGLALADVLEASERGPLSMPDGWARR